MQGTPFGLVSDFRKQLLCLSSDYPGFQCFIPSKLLLMKVPHNLTSSISARPLTIDIDINIHVKTARHMYGHV